MIFPSCDAGLTRSSGIQWIVSNSTLILAKDWIQKEAKYPIKYGKLLRLPPFFGTEGWGFESLRAYL